MMCDYIGANWFVEGLGRKKLSGLQPWHVGKNKKLPAGLCSNFDGITYATIRAASHSTQIEKPRQTSSHEALFQIKGQP